MAAARLTGKSIVLGIVRMLRITQTMEIYLVSLLPPSAPKFPIVKDQYPHFEKVTQHKIRNLRKFELNRSLNSASISGGGECFHNISKRYGLTRSKLIVSLISHKL